MGTQKLRPFTEHVCFSLKFAKFVCEQFAIFARFSLKFKEFLGKCTSPTHGKRVPFSQNSHKWRPLAENVRLFRRIHRKLIVFAEIGWLSWKTISFPSIAKKWYHGLITKRYLKKTPCVLPGGYPLSDFVYRNLGATLNVWNKSVEIIRHVETMWKNVEITWK